MERTLRSGVDVSVEPFRCRGTSRSGLGSVIEPIIQQLSEESLAHTLECTPRAESELK